VKVGQVFAVLSADA